MGTRRLKRFILESLTVWEKEGRKGLLKFIEKDSKNKDIFLFELLPMLISDEKAFDKIYQEWSRLKEH